MVCLVLAFFILSKPNLSLFVVTCFALWGFIQGGKDEIISEHLEEALTKLSKLKRSA